MGYEKIVKYYDSIFPLNPVTLHFLSAAFPPGSKVLDVGCGSGEYTAALSRAGYSAAGLDLDPEMIRRAQEKTAGQGNRPVLTTGSMLQMDRYYAPASFDGVFCIGNSLAHVEGHAQLQEVCRQFGELLRTGGTLILQIINYDRILNQNITELPTIENKEKGVSFERHYRRRGPQILFTTVLEADGMTEVSEIPLYPVTGEELITSLKDAGFAGAEKFGSFRGDPFDIASSQPLILRCHKQ